MASIGGKPQSKRPKSNSFDERPRPHSADSVNYGAILASRRTGGASPGPTSRHGAISPTVVNDNPDNYDQVDVRPKSSIADKVLHHNTEVQNILQSPQASIRLDTCPNAVAEAGPRVTPHATIPASASASQGPGESGQGNEGGTDQPARGRKRESIGGRRRRRRHYSPTGSIASWNKSRSSTGESSFSTENQPVTEPGSSKRRRLPPPLPPSPGPEPAHPSNRPPIPCQEARPSEASAKTGEQQKRPSILEETPRLLLAEDFLPDTPPQPKRQDGFGTTNVGGPIPSASATPTGTSGGSTTTEDLHWEGRYQNAPHVQAGGPEDGQQIPVQDGHQRAWRRCKCGCTLATLLVVVAFVIFVSVWAKVVSPPHSSSFHFTGFCETAKIDYNSLTSKMLTVKADIGKGYASRISHEPCDVKMTIGILNLTIDTTVNQTNINQPGLTRTVFLMEKENSSINITVCIDKTLKEAQNLIIFYVFKTAERMFEWEKDTFRQPAADCQMPVYLDRKRCVSYIYTDQYYCSHGPFSGHHYISSQFVNESSEPELPIELTVKLDLTAPRYVPTKWSYCSTTEVKTECHVDFSWFFGEVAQDNWCVFLQTWKLQCDSGLMKVEHTAHQRLDIVWLSAAIVVLVIFGCVLVYWRLIFTVARTTWRHRYFQNCRNYARLL